MNQPHRPPPDPGDPADADAAAVEVEVARTGGFAGVRRTWRVAASSADAAPWRELIDRCPWDQRDQAALPEVDRFTWRIRARSLPAPERCAEIPDSRATGPWRALIDAARAWEGADGVSG